MNIASKTTESAKKIPCLVFCGPTACGKTAILTRLFGFSSGASLAGLAEVVNADSVQVYKDLCIASAKPSAQECAELPHHLIGFLPCEDDFSVAKFVPLADEKCAEIFSRKKIPVVSGGTAFYIRHFLFGLPQTPTADMKIRQKLKSECEQKGIAAMYSRLQKIDAKSAAKIHPNDEYRVLRALEVFDSCGKPLSAFALPQKLRENYDFCVLNLTMPRDALYRKIEERAEKMLAGGLEAEIKSLVAQGAKTSFPAMQSIGYREFFDGDGNLRKNEAEQILAEIKQNTKKYAKRQQTFFNSFREAKKIPADNFSEIEKNCAEFFRKHGCVL